MRVVITTAVLVIVGVLAVSLISKLRSRSGFALFADAIADMGLVRASWARPAAALSMAAEAVVLAMLILPVSTVPGLAAAAVLFACFAATLATAVRRGVQVACHCFGASSTPVAWRHVVRGGILCAVAFTALCCASVSDTPAFTQIGAPQMLAATVVAGICVAALVWIDDLVWLFRSATQAS